MKLEARSSSCKKYLIPACRWISTQAGACNGPLHIVDRILCAVSWMAEIYVGQRNNDPSTFSLAQMAGAIDLAKCNAPKPETHNQRSKGNAVCILLHTFFLLSICFHSPCHANQFLLQRHWKIISLISGSFKPEGLMDVMSSRSL